MLSSPKLPTGIALAVALTLLVAACGSSKSDTSSTATTAGAAGCTPAKLATKSKGQLTVATDKPAYPPYFENDDPSNGEGFESAVAYAIGKQLGYSKGDVVWTVEPFNASFAPGPKDFDFDVNEISITPAREKAVDFSAPYYTANQAIVVLKSSDAAQAESLDELKGLNIGVQVGTTRTLVVPDGTPVGWNSRSTTRPR